MRRVTIAVLGLAALIATTISCGGDSRATTHDPAITTSEDSASMTGLWTRENTADAPYSATAEFCCSSTIPDSPEFTSDTQTLADGTYSMRIAQWLAGVTSSDINMSLFRFRSCTDSFMASSDQNDCTGVVDDLASAADLSLETHRVLDLSNHDTKIWILGHACLTDGIDIPSWLGDGRAFVNMMQTFQTDKAKWLDPYIQGDQILVQDVPTLTLSDGSPFRKSSCVENALEWTFPSGPTILIQGSIVVTGPNAGLIQYLTGRTLVISAGQQIAYFYGGYRP